MCNCCGSFFDLRKSEYCEDCNLHYKYFTMRTKEEILMNIFKQNYTKRIFKFQKLVNHDLTLKAMQEYAEEYHKAELLKLNKSDVISSVCTCKYDDKKKPIICNKCLAEITGID